MLSDPRLSKPIARLTQVADHIETLNDPRTSTGAPTGGAQPGSRPPGHAQCDWAARRLARILEDAVKQAEDVARQAQPRERRATAVKTVGGIRVDNTPSDDEAQPETPVRRKHSIEVRRGRAVAKFIDTIVSESGGRV